MKKRISLPAQIASVSAAAVAAFLLLDGGTTYRSGFLRAPASEDFYNEHETAPDPLPLPESAQRLEDDRSAKALLSKAHFSPEGTGMHLSPGLYRLILGMGSADFTGLLKKAERQRMTQKYGIVWNPGESGPVGLFNARFDGYTAGVLGCVACHSGRAAGRFIIGIGNKNVDTFAIGQSGTRYQKYWNKLRSFGRDRNQEEIDSAKSAVEFAQTMNVASYMNQVQGLVPISAVFTWFYKDANLPVSPDTHRAAVKIPAVFGFAEKRRVGQFCDGFGEGSGPAWGAGSILTSNQPADKVTSYMDELEMVMSALGKILPPKYPYAIAPERAKHGKLIFESNCSACHGTYATDSGGLPIYAAPKLIRQTRVGTDPDRLQIITPDLIDLVRKSSLGDQLVFSKNRGGYFAPRLNAIWARFPYLHNGSVPTLYDLLSPKAKRPRAFSLKDAGEEYRFDSTKVGLTTPDLDDAGDKQTAAILQGLEKKARWVYDTSLTGQSNVGHEVESLISDTLSETDKFDLIEYLKTL